MLSLVAGALLGFHIYSFYRTSNRVGSALIRQEQRTIAADRGSNGCSPAAPQGSTSSIPRTEIDPGRALAAVGPNEPATNSLPTASALLEVPAIGLQAPVAQGTDDAVLDVAVGHVTASAWPGQAGTVVLAAHDVTWFSRVDQLASGSTIAVVTPCQTYVYTVTDHQVVSSTTPIYQSRHPTLLLITCYPLNALFLTSQRYVVDAKLTSESQIQSPTTQLTPSAGPKVPAPPALAAQGLDLAHNTAPLGVLTIVGSPSPGWSESSGPLEDEAAVTELYFAGLRSAEQKQWSWWGQLAPGVPWAAASALYGATVTQNNADLSPRLNVMNDQFVSASISTEPTVALNGSSHTFDVTMTASVTGGALVITGWSVKPAS